jgi:hypothetical protein
MAIDFEAWEKEIAERNKSLVPAAKKEATAPQQNEMWLSAKDRTDSGEGNIIESLVDGVGDFIKGTSAYRKYMMTDEEKLQEAKKISIETGIPVNALLIDDKNMALGRSVQEQTRKRMALAPQGINDFDMNEVYESFPNLKAIIDDPNMSEEDVAITMHNVQDLTKVNGVVEAFTVGLGTDKAMYRIGEIGKKAYLGGTLTEADKQEIESLKKSIKEAKSMPSIFDDPLTALAGGAGSQLYHLGAGIVEGAKVGGGIFMAGTAINAATTAPLAVAPPLAVFKGGISQAAVTGAAATGFKYGMMSDMFFNSAGRYYEEYLNMKDQKGDQLLGEGEARTFATVAAALETGIEFANYGQIMNMIGTNYKQEILEIVAKAEGNQEALRAGLGKFLADKMRNATKMVASEAGEEAAQDVSEKGIHNTIVSYAPQSAERKYTGKEFVQGALEASTEAIPSILGVGAIGGSVSSVKSVRNFAKLQEERNDIFIGEMRLANGLEMLKNLQANMAESKLFKNSPDVYQAVVKNAVENTEFKEVRVDTELALQDEEGAQVFNQLVQEMGLEQEEVNAIVENKADLVVPTEVYATTVQNNDKFNQYISFDDKGHSIARKKYYMQVAEDMVKSINVEQEQKQAELIDSIITANFPEAGIEQDMGAAVILTNPSNPKAAWKQMHTDTMNAINAKLNGIIVKLNEGMSRGVHVVYDEGGSAKRVSDNDQWYGDFYKENKRKPNKRELLEMAREVYKGGGEKYQLFEYAFEPTEEMQEEFDALDNAFEEMYALEDIKDKIDNLTASEMSVVNGLTPSGYKVYQSVRKQMELGNRDVQQSARMNAILFARYADRMADNISKITGKEYTAEDYMRERTSIMPNATDVDERGYNQGDDTIEFNIATDDKYSREYRHSVMKKKGFSVEEIADLDKRIKDIAKDVKEISEKIPSFKAWQQIASVRLSEKGVLVPKVNAFISNGDYKLNIDLGTMCIKREASDAAMQAMVELGHTDHLGATQIQQMLDVLKEEGFMIPCEICYVESKRVRALDTANSVALHWDAVLDALGITDKQEVGKERTLTAEQQARLDRMTSEDKDVRQQAYDELVSDKYKREVVTKTNKKGKTKTEAMDNGLTASKMSRIASLMKQDSRLINRFDAGALMTSKGVDKLLSDYYDTDLAGFIASSDGAATAKPLQGKHVFDPLSFRLVIDSKNISIEDIYNIGGVRWQSFSDFDVLLAFDYAQIVAELEARTLPAHAYAKVPSFVELFGETGVKINMSLIFGISDETDADGNSAPAGLRFAKDKNGDIIYKDGKPQYEYYHADETFGAGNGVSAEDGAKRAYELRDKKGNVGTIGVGLSDEHVRMLLEDENIDMVIPYHASNMPVSVRIKTGLDKATNYEDEQTTKGKKDGLKEFSFNEALRRLGDARAAADEYLAWCKKNGCTPKFARFAKSNKENYYKLLIDFRAYDENGKYAPQESVHLTLPKNAKEILKERIKERSQQVQAVNDIKENKALVGKIVDRITKYRRIETLAMDRMKSRLNSVLKHGRGKVVTSLRAKEFFDKLSEFADKGKVSKEQVEVMRHSNNVVYGFAVGSEIYLNENNINAHTPAHEFTHIWAKVVRDMKPKLWEQGVKLLKSDKEAKVIWDEVMNDQNYANIHNNEDAVASEVLSRIVGGNNEKLIQAIFEGKRPTHNKSFGKRLLAWIEKFFGEVVDIFGLDRDVDYKEFVNAPLGAIWDEKAGKSFNALLKQWKKAKTDFDHEQITEFHIRSKADPVKTMKSYKLFEVLPDGTPTALFIDNGKPIELGVWHDADSPVIKDMASLEAGRTYIVDNDGNVTPTKWVAKEERFKNGNIKYKPKLPPKSEVQKLPLGQRYIAVGLYSDGTKSYHNVGINGSGTVAVFAMRPGWHSTDAPAARHIGQGQKGGEAQYRKPNQRWFEIENSADVDYHEEARQNPSGDIPEHIPTDGWYSFRTNTNADDRQNWIISGSIKIVRPLSEQEAREICESKGITPDLPYKDGRKDFDEVYNQTAYHGSPHKFDTFDLGAIGTGEGAQAHGWGLYFAQDKKVSEEYRERLTGIRRPALIYNGEKHEELTEILQDHLGDEYGDMASVSKDIRLLSQKIIQAIKSVRSEKNLNDILVKETESEIKRIEEKPEQSIDEFLQEASQYDIELYGLEYIARQVEASAMAMGRKARALDVAMWLKGDLVDHIKYGEGLDRQINLLESIDVHKLSFEKSGSLLEVDIPENDVLLDEQKRFNEQPPKVQKSIRDIIGDDYDVAFKNASSITKKITRTIYPKDRFWTTEESSFINTVKGSGDKPFTVREMLEYVLDDDGISTFYDMQDNIEWVLEKFGDIHPHSDLCVYLRAHLSLVYLNKHGGIDRLRGRDLYNEISDMMVLEVGDQNKATSKTLNKHGVKGITYEGGRDGRCFVVFDDKAIDIIERYNQSVRGQTKVSGMSRVVSLFESADKSTFVHELGHVALADLKMLAEMENAPEQLVKDWQVVKDWLGCKDGNLTREHHEQFAKGFEAYLRSGEAPVRGLKAVFRKFKKWLCDIYADFTQLGGKPSPEVKAVMARMLASEQEIEAEAKLQGIESITSKKEMQILDESTQAMYERWVTEAKEEAKEKVLKVAMKAVTDRMEEGRQEIIKTMREDIENDLKQRDIFKAEALIKLSGSKDILPTLGYTEERYQAELDEYGGSLEVAVERELAKAVEDMDGYTEMEGVIEAEAKKALQSSEYKAMLLTLEYEAMARKEAEESRLDKSIDKALDAIEKELRGDKPEKEDSKEVKSLKQRIADLKYTYRWREAEMKFIEQLQRAESNEAKQTAVKKLKEEIDKSKKGIRLVRDAIEGQSDSYRKAAIKRLAKMPIAQATATASWVHKERMKGSEANRLMAKGKWEEAKKAKQEQLMFSYFAAESAKIKANVEKVVRQLKKRSDSVAKGTVQMAADERYFYNHLLYVFGINRRDAIKPIEWDDNSSVNAIFKRYADNNEVYFVNEAGEYEVPSFIISAARSGDVYQSQVDTGRKKPKNALGYGALTKEDFDCLADLLSSVYTIGKNAKKLLTVKDAEGNSVDLNDAVMAICNDIMQNVKAKDDNDPTGATKKEWYEAIVEKGSNLFGELVKPETFFRRNDGGKEGHSMQFLYNPLKHAADKQLVMQAEATKAMKAIFDKYSKKGWHKKQYAFGTSLLDKEQLIVVALNWGTEINRRRIRDGYGVTTSQVDEALSHLTTEDWRLVNSLWDLIGSYWEETVAVEERLTGVGLEKQQALPFTINGKDGNIHHISGGYYPIMYDPAKSARSAEQAVDDIAKQKMSGNMVYGTHRGFTKKRTTAKVERKVYLTLEPLSKALDDVIHNICYREAVRDVNKIINSKDFEVVMVDAYGLPVYMGLKKWIRDNWAMDEHKDGFAKFAGMLRRNMTMAVMGYRVTTALLNVLNIFPMAEYIGAGRAISAVVNTYRSPKRSYDTCLRKSAFLAERAQTMDRDVREKLRSDRFNDVQKHAFTMIAKTDQMLAVPLWLSEYHRVFQEGAEKNLSPEVIEQQAVDAGDAAVRRVFGSGDVKDLSSVQRGTEVTKALTMFYSYMNTVLNALVFRYGRGIDNKEWGSFAKAIVFWLVLTSVGEALLRSLWGNDDDDILEKIAKSFVGQAFGMFPVARDVFRLSIEVAMGGKVYDAKMTSAFDAVPRTVKAVQSVMSDNKDKIDAGRDITKAANAFTGMSDTLTDALWTFARYADNDFDNDIGEFLKAVVFDKKLR